MDNLTFSKIKEALDKHNSIAIAVAANPSIDQMAAGLALYLSLSGLGKTISIATPNAPLVEVSSLVGIDKVTTSLGGEGGDLVVSFPYREGEIEKVSYTRDDNFLNIVVKAGELGLNFDQKDVQFTRGGTAPEILFVIGAQRVSDLGNLYDPAKLKDTIVVNIDNNDQNQGFGDILMVSSRLSSLSEAVTNLILALSLKLDVDSAQNLMLGIAQATQNFQSELTSPLAFEMAGVLLRAGAIRPNSTFSASQPSASRFSSAVPSFQQPQPTDNFIKQQEEIIKQLEVEKKEVKKDISIAPQMETESEPVNPPDDWLEPKIYKGSTNF